MGKEFVTPVPTDNDSKFVTACPNCCPVVLGKLSILFVDGCCACVLLLHRRFPVKSGPFILRNKGMDVSVPMRLRDDPFPTINPVFGGCVGSCWTC